MIDSEFRSQRTPPDRCQALPLRNVGGSVLYHSRFGLASYEKLLDDLSEMAVPGSAGRFTCGKGCYQQVSPASVVTLAVTTWDTDKKSAIRSECCQLLAILQS
jgi:hypothetical protein